MARLGTVGAEGKKAGDFGYFLEKVSDFLHEGMDTIASSGIIEL